MVAVDDTVTRWHGSVVGTDTRCVTDNFVLLFTPPVKDTTGNDLYKMSAAREELSVTAHGPLKSADDIWAHKGNTDQRDMPCMWEGGRTVTSWATKAQQTGERTVGNKTLEV